MDHSEFVQLWQTGRLEIDVDRRKALSVASSTRMPTRYRVAHTFWTWVWMLSIPAAFVVMYLYVWWTGLLMLCVATPILSKAVKKSAMEFMIAHSIESPEFWQFAMDEGVIVVRQKS